MDEVAKEMLKDQRDKVFSMRAKLEKIEKMHSENLKIYKETDYSFTEELYHSGGMSKESWEQFKDAYEMLKMSVSMSPTMISNSRKMLAEEEAKLREMEKYYQTSYSDKAGDFIGRAVIVISVLALVACVALYFILD